jgi:hypothetical protein
VTEERNEDRVHSPASGEPAGVDPVLRAKYLDYCSARISEVFLSLSDESVYELMEEAAVEGGLDSGSLGFRSMMRLVTRKLQRSIPLPDLETWVEEYRLEPERYEPLLLGLWKEQGAES